jgi:hypothetical protein
MIKKIFAVIVVFVVLTACRPAPLPETPIVTVTETARAETVQPTPTEIIPTRTPAPRHLESGETLNVLWDMNEGISRARVKFPENTDIPERLYVPIGDGEFPYSNSNPPSNWVMACLRHAVEETEPISGRYYYYPWWC